MKCWVLLGLGVGFFLSVHANEIRISTAAREKDRLTVRWTAEAERVYEVQSAHLASGPWRARTNLDAILGAMEWSDPEAANHPQQFYRLAASSKTNAPGQSLLLNGDNLPKAAAQLGEQSGEICANAVFLASQLGANGQQLVSTGTLTQQGAVWSYAPSPADRLTVRFVTGTNLSFYVTRMQGDFSVDAATFLQRNHNFDYRVVSPGVGDMTFTSDVGTGSPSFRASVRGSITISNVTYAADLALSGDYRFEIDTSGSSYLNDYRMTGTLTAPQMQLTVDQRRRFEMIVTRTDLGGGSRTESASADQDWINNTLTLGADTYQWVGVTKQKSFKEGKPSSIDTYWKASGEVRKNGQAFGTYQMQADSVFGFLRFYLVLPSGSILLESWNALL